MCYWCKSFLILFFLLILLTSLSLGLPAEGGEKGRGEVGAANLIKRMKEGSFSDGF
jgi:hypothetical protein